MRQIAPFVHFVPMLRRAIQDRAIDRDDLWPMDIYHPTSGCANGH